MRRADGQDKIGERRTDENVVRNGRWTRAYVQRGPERGDEEEVVVQCGGAAVAGYAFDGTVWDGRGSSWASASASADVLLGSNFAIESGHHNMLCGRGKVLG